MSGGFSANGEGRALRSLTGAANNFRAGLQQAANMSGQLIVRQVQTGMASAGGGRVYGSHQASAPGGYPAIQSGQLVGSIDHEVSGARFLRVGSRGAFNRGFDYAIGQHEGTSKMGARPYMTKAVDATQGQVESILGTVTFRKIVGGG